MKILHLPVEIANQIFVTVKAQRLLGLDSHSAAFVHPFRYQQDIIISRSKNIFLRRMSKVMFFMTMLFKYDVFHYHTGYLLPFGLDVRILKTLRKKIFIEFWGSEIRLYDIEKKRNKFFVSDNLLNQEDKIKRLLFWSSITKEVIMPDHSMDVFLEPYFDKIDVVGQRIEIDKYRPSFPNRNKKKPVVVHAPSSKSTKGTQYVSNAIDTLRGQGLSFEYIEVFDMSHEEAIEVYKKADIVIDQLLIGSYGILACECMALGKPVICYILEENIAKYGEDFPIVNANIHTLSDVIKELILSPEKRHNIGKASRLYAEKVHDSKKVAERLIKIYNG